MDSRIALAGTPLDVGRSVGIYQNALLAGQNKKQGELQNKLLSAQVQSAENQVTTEGLFKADALFKSIAPLMQEGKLQESLGVYDQLAPQLGFDDEDRAAFISSLSNPSQAYRALEGASNAYSQAQQRSASAQSLPSDARNRLVSQSIKDPAERRRFELAAGLDPVGLEQEKADIEADLTVNKERAKQTESRRSDFLREQGDRNRIAARSKQTLARASKLADMAQQGITGNIKVGLSRLIPSVNVESEADLDQAFKQIALEGLQAFKGPTTDFEFGVVQDIAGDLGSGASANKAKIKALQRAVWFTQQEFKQSKQWLKDEKSPDDFSFDFGERIKTKRGEYSLQDLQDTAVANSMTIEEVLQALDK